MTKIFQDLYALERKTKILQRKIKEDLNKWESDQGHGLEDSIFLRWQPYTNWFLYLTHSLTGIFDETDKSILKSILKSKQCRIAETSMNRKETWEIKIFWSQDLL